MALDIVGPANAPNAVTVRPADTRTFGATDTWTQDCTSPVANDGTKIQAGFLNGLIGQFRNAIRGNGLTGASAEIVVQDNADDSMLLKAMRHLIQRGKEKYVADTGAANAYVATLSPAAAELIAGMVARVKITTTNTTASTLNVNGLGVKSVVQSNGGAVTQGMLLAGSIVEFIYNGTAWQVPAGTKAPGLAVPNRFTDTAVGTRNFTPTVTGWHRVTLNGAGGGGGGASAGAAVVSGGGGGGGQAVDYLFLVAGTNYSYTIGTGGAGGSTGGSTAAPGGATSFSGPSNTPSAAGGGGGLGSAAGGFGVGGGFGSGVSSNGYILAGGPGFSASPQISQGGQGGVGAGFGGAGGQASFGGSNAGTAPGGGASGTVNVQAGAAGGGGQLIVEW